MRAAVKDVYQHQVVDALSQIDVEGKSEDFQQAHQDLSYAASLSLLAFSSHCDFWLSEEENDFIEGGDKPYQEALSEIKSFVDQQVA